MPKWMWRRFIFSLVVLFASVIINFAIPRLMPGDITDIYASESMPMEARQAILERFGLDQPILTQFWVYIRNTFTGYWGVSFFQYPTPVSNLIGEALPRSLGILLPAEIIYVLIGYYLGVKSGWKAGSKTDSVITGTFLALWAVPVFWMAMIVLFIFGFKLGWFPISGYMTIGIKQPNVFAYIWDLVYHAILPILTLIICRIGTSQLLMRNTITITLKENYITTARAKGMSENRVKYRHASRNALLPLVTSTGMGFAMAVSGSIFVEKIYSYPGIGRLIFGAVLQQDFPVIQGCFFILTIVVIIAVFSLDLIYSRLDPRVRY